MRTATGLLVGLGTDCARLCSGRMCEEEVGAVVEEKVDEEVVEVVGADMARRGERTGWRGTPTQRMPPLRGACLSPFTFCTRPRLVRMFPTSYRRRTMSVERV